MAKITKSNAQMEALKSINEKLRILSKIENMDKKPKSGNTTLRVGDVKVATSDIHFTVKTVKLLKGRLIGEIKAKCLKFNIDLDNSEKRLLGEVVEDLEGQCEVENTEDFEVNENEHLEIGTEEINDNEGLEQVEADAEIGDNIQDEISVDEGLEQSETDFDIDAFGSLGF